MLEKKDLAIKGVCEACSIFEFASICVAVGCIWEMAHDSVEVGFIYS